MHTYPCIYMFTNYDNTFENLNSSFTNFNFLFSVSNSSSFILSNDTVSFNWFISFTLAM